MSVQSWLSSSGRKALGWRREWAFSPLGSHVDATNAVPEVLLQPKVSQATRPCPLPHILIRPPERNNEQKNRSDSRASAGPAGLRDSPGPGVSTYLWYWACSSWNSSLMRSQESEVVNFSC